MKFRISFIRKFLPSPLRTIKVLSVTIIAMIAMSGPVFATSAVLIPYLTIIQQVISDQLTKTISDGFSRTAQNLIKSQVEQYTKELTANMMPGAFCEADIVRPIIVGEVARATGYEEAKGLFAVTGADTVINGQRAAGQLPPPPTMAIAQHNAEVRNYIRMTSQKNNNCSPLQATPVAGVKISCSQEERRVATGVLLGASPPAELPGAATAGAMGEVYESVRTTSISRKQLAGLALADAGSVQKEQAIAAYRELLGKVTVDDMKVLSADGAVQRDAATLQRLHAHLLLESWVEQLETKRLIATVIAQQAEVDDREVLAAMRRRN